MHYPINEHLFDQDDLEFTPDLTLVLVGRTGNGKSATGNSIIGSKKFISKRSSSGVTSTSELKTTVLKDGRLLNVIDTPGLFDSSRDLEYLQKEIVRSINLARNGIHAVLVVFSAINRFSDEEKAVISSLCTLFGSKIYDYMIIVFTGGDELAEDEVSLDQFLSDIPESLKEIVACCGNRCVLFDNKTRDEAKKASQLQELLFSVNMVSEKTCGEPYTNEIFTELKKANVELLQDVRSLKENCNMTEEEILVLVEQMQDKQSKRIVEMFEAKFMEVKLMLEQALEEAQAARERAEENAKESKKNHEEEMNKMREELERLQQQGRGWCVMSQVINWVKHVLNYR